MCVVPAETPADPLAPYERRVLAHVALRAGVRGEVPAPALSDGFEGGEAAFMKAFREEVTADTVRRGLRRPRLSGGRIGLLCLVLLVPAGALALALAAATARPTRFSGRVLVRPVPGHHRHRGQPAPQRGRAGGPGAVARGGRRVRRPGAPRRVRGRPGPGPGAGGVRPAGEERGVVQLPGQLAAAPGRDIRLAVAAGHRLPGGHHLRPDARAGRRDLAVRGRPGGRCRRRVIMALGPVLRASGSELARGSCPGFAEFDGQVIRPSSSRATRPRRVPVCRRG